MTPLLLLFGASRTIKKQTYLTLLVIGLLVSLPLIALVSITNIAALGLLIGGYDGPVTLYNGPLDSADGYAYGNCTYWVSLLRAQIGQPIPNNWGNAINWAFGAQLAGYVIDHTPSYGAIMQDPNAPGGEGHVAFVESVDPTTGAWTISEMNRVGFDEVDERTLPATAALGYNFIHGVSQP